MNDFEKVVLRLVKALKLTDKVFDYYHKEIENSEDVTREQVSLKMTRNMHLAIPYNHSSGRTWYAYGQLRFAVENNIIGWIEIKNRQPAIWNKDQSKYNEITKKLNIR